MEMDALGLKLLYTVPVSSAPAQGRQRQTLSSGNLEVGILCGLNYAAW